MVLVNAVYFNAPWQKEFDERKTRDVLFFANGRVAEAPKVPTMHAFIRVRMRVHEQDEVKVLQLPYAGGDFAMFIVLPSCSSFGTIGPGS